MKDRDSVYHNSYLLDLAAEEIPLWNSSHGAQPQKASGR